MTASTVDSSVFTAVPFRIVELSRMQSDEALQSLLQRATDLRASDLFLLSDERYVTVAVRRFGAMERLAVVSTELGRQLMSQIKAQAAMDICEKRRPADGRWIVACGDSQLDLRLNFTPTLHGEDLTIRICDRSRGSYRLDELGLAPALQQELVQMLNQPGGLLLVTGPTGAGKTTTLYACLRYLNDGTRKINTLEDPIEYALDGVRQSQVNPRIGLDFPELFRHVLRQAPDVVMIGEIRDGETMMTAVRAANSGQLVLATLHSPTAAGAVTSMLALEANPHFLSASLLGVLSQRLFRSLCRECRIPVGPETSYLSTEEISRLSEPAETVTAYKAGGCDRCFQTGYAGRTGVFELMSASLPIRQLIAHSAPVQQIRQAALRGGMIDLRQSALTKVLRGEISSEDVQAGMAAEQFG
ncbi:MAG: GspE/PulE family protein [Pirellulaceae bacterium]